MPSPSALPSQSLTAIGAPPAASVAADAALAARLADEARQAELAALWDITAGPGPAGGPTLRPPGGSMPSSGGLRPGMGTQPAPMNMMPSPPTAHEMQWMAQQFYKGQMPAGWTAEALDALPAAQRDTLLAYFQQHIWEMAGSPVPEPLPRPTIPDYAQTMTFEQAIDVLEAGSLGGHGGPLNVGTRAQPIWELQPGPSLSPAQQAAQQEALALVNARMAANFGSFAVPEAPGLPAAALPEYLGPHGPWMQSNLAPNTPEVPNAALAKYLRWGNLASIGLFLLSQPDHETHVPPDVNLQYLINQAQNDPTLNLFEKQQAVVSLQNALQQYNAQQAANAQVGSYHNAVWGPTLPASQPSSPGAGFVQMPAPVAPPVIPSYVRQYMPTGMPVLSTGPQSGPGQVTAQLMQPPSPGAVAPTLGLNLTGGPGPLPAFNPGAFDH